jgi:hypothetical protein
MAGARVAHAATRLNDGRVLVIGGTDNSSCGLSCTGLASAELYDPATGEFSPTGSMSDPGMSGTATLLSDGRVLVAGGRSTSGPLAGAELYDPATGRFSRTGSLVTARDEDTATPLPDGRVLIAGGSPTSAELYQP